VVIYIKISKVRDIIQLKKVGLIMNKDKLVIDELFKSLKNIFNGNDIIYVSTPINTGERFINWYKSEGKVLEEDIEKYNKVITKNVIEPNIRNVKECIKRIRQATGKVVIDPTTFEDKALQWDQDDFYNFWSKVIKELVNEVIFLDGWEYSIGCCYELLAAIENNKNIYFQDMRKLTIEESIIRLNNSISTYLSNNLEQGSRINEILQKIKKYNNNKYYDLMKNNRKEQMKDEKLDFLITNEIANIAQFISFEPNSSLRPRFVHINNFNNQEKLSNRDIIEKLILSAPSKSVNIRSFSKETMKGNRLVFNKGIDDIDEILNIIKENSTSNKYSIVNENIDIKDSGVSGVMLGDVIEFSPEDTPKCVDKAGICSLPREIGFKILLKVYGFLPDANFDPNYRIEFSIHPSRQGVRREHTIVWEYEHYEKVDYKRKISWPNNFSKFIGDKVFGLLIADSLGVMVPKTTVISRKIAPFSFGTSTGLNEKWIRTCPVKKEPGKFYTGSNWIDPFELMVKEESKGSSEISIASIISQDAVEAIYSGAAFVTKDEKSDLIEGVSGRGDKFMVGEQNKESLPMEVIAAVKTLNNQLRCYYGELGDVSVEWVYDGTNVWLVQLNQLKGKNKYDNLDSNIIVQGNPSRYKKVFVEDGLDSLRKKIDSLKGKNIGIELIGNVGVTSHFGDLLRLANIPSILKSEE
jgi:hypothetical protein